MTITNSNQTGLFKVRYGTLIDLTEKKYPLQDLWKFDATNKIGDTFNDDIAVTMSHGFVQGGLGSLSSLTIGTDRPSTSAQSAVQAAPVTAFRNVSYAEWSRALSGDGGSFATFVDKRVMQLVQGLRVKVEANMLYGRSSDGIGTCNAISGTSTSRVLTFTGDSTATHYNTFARGFWTGLEGMELDATAAATPTTVLNTNAALVLSAVGDGTITVTCNATDGGYLDTAIGSGVVYLFLRGTCATESYGLDYALTTTGANPVWGINVNLYSNWVGNTLSMAGGRLTFESILSGAEALENRGYEGELTLFVNPKSFKNLISDQAALRMYVGEGLPGEFANGTRKLVFASGDTTINVRKHRFIKPREAFLVRTEGGRRIGSSDIVDGFPKIEGGLVVNMPTITAYQFRLFADMALYHPFFGHCLKFTNINNAA